MDPAGADGGQPVSNAQTNDSLNASISSEDSESWTLLGKAENQLGKEPSGVQIVESGKEGCEDGMLEEYNSKTKQQHDIFQSVDSQQDESSDGISVISENDGFYCDRNTVHYKHNTEYILPSHEPLTPPYTPDKILPHSTPELKVSENTLQLQQTENKSIETIKCVVDLSQKTHVGNTSWIIFGAVGTVMAAIILGNSMRLQNQVSEINFEHEKRISELELENGILRKEMNKLRHLYTRTELEEQVQQAEFEWIKLLRKEQTKIAATFPDVEYFPKTPEQLPMRKVPVHDAGVKRKVVWSGDDEEPMLIADKDYVLPAFCYKQDLAVQDKLFSDYSARYCDVKKRKIEAKQKKFEFKQKRSPKQDNYNQFIHQTSQDPTHESASVGADKLASPFNIDYKKAFEAIRAEGSVIVEALGSILDLSPQPEGNPETKQATERNRQEQKHIQELDEQHNDKNEPIEHLQASNEYKDEIAHLWETEQGRNNRKYTESSEIYDKGHSKRMRRSRQNDRDREGKKNDENAGRTKVGKLAYKGDGKIYSYKMKYRDVGENFRNPGDGANGVKHDSKNIQNHHEQHRQDNNNRQYRINPSDKDDDYCKKKLVASDETNLRDQNEQRHEDQLFTNNDQINHYNRDVASYLEQHKHEEWKHDAGSHKVTVDRNDYCHKHQQKYSGQQKHAECLEKRPKERTNCDQIVVPKHGECQEKRYNKKEDCRQNGGKYEEKGKHKNMESKSNWYSRREHKGALREEIKAK